MIVTPGKVSAEEDQLKAGVILKTTGISRLLYKGINVRSAVVNYLNHDICDKISGNISRLPHADGKTTPRCVV